MDAGAEQIKALAQRFLDRLPEVAMRKAREALEDEGVTCIEAAPSTFRFVYPALAPTPYQGQTAIPVEARIKDADDHEMSVLVYLDDRGRLFEVEFIRWDESEASAPRWETLQLW